MIDFDACELKKVETTLVYERLMGGSYETTFNVVSHFDGIHFHILKK